AYPSYQEYVRRAHRSEAKALLSDIAARMERYYFDNNSYSTDLTDLGFASATPESAEGHYAAAAAAGASGDIATSYTLTATLIGTLDDPKCGDLSIDSRGTKDASGSGGVEVCW
ncbi:MAG: type IV pilin protein, partial [Gammaproteobacteria bacterium]